MARNPLYPDALQPMEMQGNDLIGYKPTLADGWDYNAKAYNDWVAQQQADLVARGLNDPQTGWPTQAGWVDAAKQIGNSMLMGTTAPGIRAFHGSPHSFDQFQMDKIGTGEGAQAFGQGLYFAENEGVAKGYRDALAGQKITWPTKKAQTAFESMPQEFQDNVTSLLQKNAAIPSYSESKPADIKAHFQMLNDYANHTLQSPEGGSTAMHAPGAAQSVADATALLLKSKMPKYGPAGHMYEVNINADPEHMLDWDKPLSEQHPLVQDAWQKSGLPNNAPQSGVAPTVGDELSKASLVTSGSTALANAGIPGIRYLDRGSRGSGQGTRNIVAFNPENIEIMRKYGLAGLMAGGTAAAASDQ